MFRVCVLFFALMAAGGASAMQLTDVAGRAVTLEAPAETMVIGDGRVLTALALLNRADPVSGVLSILSDLNRTDPDLMSYLTGRHPHMAEIPMTVGTNVGASAEAIITQGPDVAIFSMSGHGPSVTDTELVAQLEAAGIPVVFIDFRLDPLKNTVASIELLGRLLGHEREASEYVAFYTAHKKAITDRLEGFSGKRPTVFVQAHPGRFPCCVGMAHGMLGPFVEVVGGENISARAVPGPVGRHTLEFLLAENPDIWIGTASGTPEDIAGGKAILTLGMRVDNAMAQASAKAVAKAEGLQALDAFRTGHAHGIWHGFYNSPFNIYALEAFAKWIHPELFADLDPEATFAEIHERFWPVERPGLYSASLEP